MKIIIIEDNDYKNQKIVDFIHSNFIDAHIDSCKSYSSAIALLNSNKYNFAIIDMSLPTFDKDIGTPSSEFRTFGGMDIAKYIKRKKLNLNFIFLTQYISFAVDDKSYDFANLEKIAMETYPTNFKGCVFYDNSSLEWKERVRSLMVQP